MALPYNPDAYHRRSVRLKGYGYTRAGAYFVTIVTRNRECLFGAVEAGNIRLSPSGEVVDQCLGELKQHFPGLTLDIYVVMPNHLHAVLVLPDRAGRGPFGPCQRRGEALAQRSFDIAAIQADASPLQEMQGKGQEPGLGPKGTQPGSLGAIIQNFKSVSSRRVNSLRRDLAAPVWQRNYYDRIIRDADELDRIRQYIADNPARWDEDTENPASPYAVNLLRGLSYE